jgi:actin related protein 2/3 complex subunit 1A/1B
MWNKLITELYISDCSAMRKFQSLDRQARIETSDTTLETIHQNAITCLCLYKGGKGSASSVSTSGLDGQLVTWDLQVVALVIVEVLLI